VYVADAVKAELPNRAVIAFKPEEEWAVMDESYQFLFSLHPNDWVTVRLKGETKEGYFSGLDRATGCISLWLHDRNQSVGKDGQWRGIGIKTALAVEKYHVGLLGHLHRVHYEERLPINPNRKR
jgi:CRISPR-associated endonuclease Csn1